MKNFIQEECSITIPAPAAVTSGKLVVVGSLVGICSTDAASGVDVAIATEGVYSYAKTSALAIAVGDKVYYDSANDVLNKTASGNTLVGVAVAAAANPSDTVIFMLKPTIN